MYKTKSATIPEWRKEGLRVLPTAAELLAIDDCWRKESQTNLKVGHDRLSTF